MKVHVVPLNDLVEHPTDEDCPCGPTPIFEKGGVVFVHHSLDGREFTEPDYKAEDIPEWH